MCHQNPSSLTSLAVSSKSMLTMLHYALVYMAYHTSRWLPRNERLKLPKSSRYCQQPLLNNLTAFIIMSFMATGFAVTFTLIDPVPQSFRAAYHGFGLVSFVQGLCTIVLTLTAQQCAKTTPELYYLSLILSLACILSTVFYTSFKTAWPLKLLQMHNREHPVGLYDRLIRQLHHLQTQGSPEGGAVCPTLHQGQTNCHPGHLQHLMSQEGQKDHQGHQPPEPRPVHPAIIQKARSVQVHQS
ncbi:uncharacterized protein LOC118400001 isoform X2 [Oncorhynchus keta]|uniref:uncharacterized protein LOC118400001 isoform X2 n=1 Tax=Oncorhynchus keta TaxID=8018 RepID=UPI00227AD2BA|nr:uncharacterized protein LOC118400001 isoform X2 [Oncorhynchus keta]